MKKNTKNKTNQHKTFLISYCIFNKLVYICIFWIATWGAWGDYGSCSVACGNGIQTRYRECYDPDSTGGNCVGQAPGFTRECNNGPCRMYQTFYWFFICQKTTLNVVYDRCIPFISLIDFSFFLFFSYSCLFMCVGCVYV